MNSQSLFQQSNNNELIKKFRELISESGGNPELIDDVIQTDAIKDYQNLYQNYKKLPTSMRQDIAFVWQLLCLSGEGDAFDYAREKHKLSKNTRSKWGENALHYAMLSGVDSQVDKALSLGVAWDSEAFNYSNIIHFAILSGNPAQLEKALDIEEANNKKLPLETRKGRNAFHYAATTGNIEMVDTILSLIQTGKWKIDIHATDNYGFNAMNYAIYKSNQRVIKSLEKAGIVAMPNQDKFSFGEIDTRRIPSKKI